MKLQLCWAGHISMLNLVNKLSVLNKLLTQKESVMLMFTTVIFATATTRDCNNLAK